MHAKGKNPLFASTFHATKYLHDEAPFMAALTENIQILGEGGGGGLRGLIRRHSHGKKGG